MLRAGVTVERGKSPRCRGHWKEGRRRLRHLREWSEAREDLGYLGEAQEAWGQFGARRRTASAGLG